MDWKALAGKVANIAEEFAPVVEELAGPEVTAAIEIGKTVLSLGQQVIAVAGTDAATLAAALPALEARVVALAQAESAALRG